MPTISKQRLQTFSNSEFADNSDFSVDDIDRAFDNYNRLIGFVRSQEVSATQRGRLFLERVETQGLRDLGDSTVDDLLELGKLEAGIGELAAVPGIGMKTICNIVPALLALDLTDDPQRVTRDGPVPKRVNYPRSHYKSAESLEYLAALGNALTTPVAFSMLPGALGDTIENLMNDLERFKELGEWGSEIVDFAKDLLDVLKKAKKAVEDATKPTTPRDPRKTGGSAVRGADAKPEEFNGVISKDKYAELFGEALDSEPTYTVWLDRLMAFEVDGAGDDEAFWTAESRTYLRDPDRIVRYSLISNVYSIDQREEYRLKPKNPKNDRRAKPLPDKDWKIRGFLEDRDAAFALRVDKNIRGIPLSKLRRVEIDFNLYESDAATDLIDAVAAVGSASIAALGIVKGAFTAPQGSTTEMSNALKKALENLNTLISKEVKTFADGFTFTPGEFRTAYRTGQTFTVTSRKTTAAMGLAFQRSGGGLTEDDDIVDTGEADAIFARNRGRLRDEDFYEKFFESYYEFRLRFERRDPPKQNG